MGNMSGHEGAMGQTVETNAAAHVAVEPRNGLDAMDGRCPAAVFGAYSAYRAATTTGDMHGGHAAA